MRNVLCTIVGVMTVICSYNHVCNGYMVEGSGEDLPLIDDTVEDSWNEPHAYTQLMSAKRTRTVLNATLRLNMENIQADFTNRHIDMTVWLHQEWIDPNLQFVTKNNLIPKNKRLIFPPSEILPRIQSPQSVVKNAQHFIEHRGAHAYHGLVAIQSDASVHESQKVTVRLPCVSTTSQPGSGRRTRRRFDCALRYGSYARAARWLSLRWHAYPLNDNMQVACVDAQLQRPCVLVTVTTSRILSTFEADTYEDLLATFALDIEL